MPNSVNLVLKKNATASSYVKPYDATRAVDGLYLTANPLNRWLCNTLPAILSVDLGAISVINRWVVRHMPVAGWPSPDYNLSDFRLQISFDNVNWSDVDGVSGNTSSLTDRNISTLVIARFVRLIITKGLRNNPQLASLMEFEVYGYATPYLSGLTVNGGQLTLTPSFAPSTFAYTIADVPNSTSSINVTPTAQDSGATIKVNNVVVVSGKDIPVALNVGSNTINIVVTATDGVTSQTYTLTVVRKSLELSGLTISAGTLNPSFASSTLSYTSNVGGDVTSTTVTPSTNINGATITVNGTIVASGTASAPINLNIGNGNVIKVVITDGTATKEYTITVTKAPNLYLKNVKLDYTGNRYSSSNTISMDHSNLTYPTNVAKAATQVAVTPTAEDSGVSISVNGQVLTSGGTSQKISLSTADTQIPVSVSYPGIVGSRDYIITITKQ